MDHAEHAPPAPRNWLNTIFLASVHAVGLAGGGWYVASHGAPPLVWALAALWTVLTVFGLSAGYHRLFSHRSYEANPVLRAVLLGLGAAAFQNSALTWAADHRRHHRRVDTDEDPYNARRGFWWSHVGWVLRETPPAEALYPVPDLESDPLVRWQHRLYPYIGTVTGLVIPALLGLALGDIWAGLLLAGFLRLVVVYHVTFAVNSFAHLLGRRPYSERNTSRDSTLVALLTMGEGYHNFHHTFPSDYRNGVRAHQFDPSKWGIWVMARFGMARNLRRTPQPAIMRARLRVEAHRLTQLPVSKAHEAARALSQALDETLTRWQAVLATMQQAAARREWDLVRRFRGEVRQHVAAFRVHHDKWRQLLRAAADWSPATGVVEFPGNAPGPR